MHFIDEPIDKVGFHEDLKEDLIHPCQVAAFGQRALYPSNDRYMIPQLLSQGLPAP